MASSASSAASSRINVSSASTSTQSRLNVSSASATTGSSRMTVPPPSVASSRPKLVIPKYDPSGKRITVKKQGARPKRLSLQNNKSVGQKATPTEVLISRNFYNAFLPYKWFMVAFFRFPFQFREKMDKTIIMEYTTKSFQSLSFYFSSIFATIMFVMCLIGTALGFFLNGDKARDRCGMTWERVIMTRQFALIMFTLTQLCMTMVGGWYMLIYSKDFVDYYNFWNSQLMLAKYNPTEGVRCLAYRGHGIFIGVLFLSLAVYFSGKLVPLEEGSAFMIQAFVYFFKKDLYLWKADTGVFNVSDFKKLDLNCCNCFDCFTNAPGFDEEFCKKECWNSINHPSSEYRAVKIFGIFIQLYAMMGARCLIIPFEFFCHCLKNYIKCWNARLTYGLSSKPVDKMENIFIPERQRLSFPNLTTDHSTIFQLFAKTEDNFAVILCCYYACLYVNLTSQLYFLGLVGTQLTCAEAIQREVDYVDLKTGLRCLNLEDMKYYADEGHVSFEDPCADLKDLRQQSGFVGVTLLLVTLFMFISSVSEAAEASDSAQNGFLRLRKHGYISCNTTTERNFIHTMVFSYIGPKAMEISGGGYFSVRRRIILVVLSSCFIYFVITLGFKPGVIQPVVRCEDNKSEAVVSYSRFVW